MKLFLLRPWIEILYKIGTFIPNRNVNFLSKLSHELALLEYVQNWYVHFNAKNEIICDIIKSRLLLKCFECKKSLTKIRLDFYFKTLEIFDIRKWLWIFGHFQISSNFMCSRFFWYWLRVDWNFANRSENYFWYFSYFEPGPYFQN